MKKHLLTLLMLCTGMICLAQADSTLNVGETAGDVTAGLVKLLAFFGIKLTGWAAIIPALIPVIMHYLGSRRLKQMHANELKQIVEASPTMKEEHVSRFKEFIDRLEGKK